MHLIGQAIQATFIIMKERTICAINFNNKWIVCTRCKNHSIQTSLVFFLSSLSRASAVLFKLKVWRTRCIQCARLGNKNGKHMFHVFSARLFLSLAYIQNGRHSVSACLNKKEAP